MQNGKYHRPKFALGQRVIAHINGLCGDSLEIKGTIAAHCGECPGGNYLPWEPHGYRLEEEGGVFRESTLRPLA